jgi:hypothetical protein
VALIVAAEHPQLVRAVVVEDSILSLERQRAHLDRNRLLLTGLRALVGSGRSTAELQAALREVPVAVPGHAAPVRAGDAFGAHSPWFADMAANLRGTTRRR